MPVETFNPARIPLNRGETDATGRPPCKQVQQASGAGAAVCMLGWLIRRLEKQWAVESLSSVRGGMPARDGRRPRGAGEARTRFIQ